MILGKPNVGKSSLMNVLTETESRERDIRLHKIEWHRKISLSAACLVLFLIGAPLGSIIRKGGLGSPLVLSIVFFMIFYFSFFLFFWIIQIIVVAETFL